MELKSEAGARFRPLFMWRKGAGKIGQKTRQTNYWRGLENSPENELFDPQNSTDFQMVTLVAGGGICYKNSSKIHDL